MSFRAQTTRHRPQYVSISFSKLKNYAACPRRHNEVDIEKKWGGDEQSDALVFGNAVHKALEERLFRGTPIPPHLQSGMRMDLEGAAQKVLGGHPNAKAWEVATGGNLQPEQGLGLTEDFQPCEFFDRTRNVWMRVKIDVAKLLGPGAVLYDWKTGKVSDRESDQLLMSAATILYHNPQLQAVRTMYVWLKEDATTSLTVTRDELPKFWSEFLPKATKYTRAVQAKDFPPTPSGLCRYCPVNTCEHHPGE